MKTKEDGVTLVALVTTIILLLILATVGVTVGSSTIDSAKFTKFKSELKIIQNKVNDLNQKNETDIGQELNEEQKKILDIEVISNIIYKDVSDDEKQSIQEGFRYCDSTYIQDNLALNSVKREYLINVEYRYVISKDGFEYEGTTYYMIDQIENEIYNVRYNDKNEKTGSFEVSATQEDNKWKIEISNISYNGYIDNWQVKYKLDGISYWEITDKLSFYISEPGEYTFNVIYGDEVDLGSETITILKDAKTSDGSWNGVVNTPKIDDTGLIPVYFDEDGTTIELTDESSEEEWEKWYDYSNQKWANAVTKDIDGNITGYFVWIPRYQYKINDDNETVDIEFVKITQKTATNSYTYVHPAFRNGSSTNYMNGEWDKEIPGFWIAKYQAGYQQNTLTDNKDGTVSIPDITINEEELAMSNENHDSTLTTSKTTATVAVGEISDEVKMSYPVFLPLTYVYNYLATGDAYTLSQDIKNGQDFYGLTNIDSHMTKNSEWGAVAYLTQSQYGRNGVEPNINNYRGSTSKPYRTVVSGVYSNTSTADTETDISNVYAYYEEENGVKGSSTGNITGVYDLNGAGSERVTAYITNGNTHLLNGSSFVAITQADTDAYKTLSTKYATIYPYNESSEDSDSYTNDILISVYKALVNESNGTYGYGDAILETAGWYSDNINYLHTIYPIFTRGGIYGSGSGGGVFSYGASYGNAYYYYAFRTVLIPD